MSQMLLNLNMPEASQDDYKKEFSSTATKSIRYANREQIEFQMQSLDQLLPENHKARDVWEFVNQLDLSKFYEKIKVLKGCGGPRSVDPRIYFALWLYAILEGYNSARHIAKLCKEHHTYIWICGGVSINYHELSDFRTQDSSLFRSLLQESIALMWKSGTFTPETVAQDGTRVKACAGNSSLRREASLEKLLKEAEEYLIKLDKEQKENPSASTSREKAAQIRAARERKERIEAAQSEMIKYKQARKESCKRNHESLSQKDLDNMRTSTTDPECRKMKMGDGGYRPAYNVQFVTSKDKKMILGVEVVNTLDPGMLDKMMENVNENLQSIECPMPSKWLADSAYANKTDAESAEVKFPKVTLYSPPTGNKTVDAYTSRKTDNEAMANLRNRMKTEEAQIIYKDRCSTAEFANAIAKNRGMREFLVKGLNKVCSMALIYAIAHNMTMYLG